MGHALKSKDWELVFLGLVDVDLLMPVRLGTSSDSEKSILFTIKGESWNLAVENS